MTDNQTEMNEKTPIEESSSIENNVQKETIVEVKIAREHYVNFMDSLSRRVGRGMKTLDLSEGVVTYQISKKNVTSVDPSSWIIPECVEFKVRRAPDGEVVIEFLRTDPIGIQTYDFIRRHLPSAKPEPNKIVSIADTGTEIYVYSTQEKAMLVASFEYILDEENAKLILSNKAPYALIESYNRDGDQQCTIIPMAVVQSLFETMTAI